MRPHDFAWIACFGVVTSWSGFAGAQGYAPAEDPNAPEDDGSSSATSSTTPAPAEPAEGAHASKIGLGLVPGANVGWLFGSWSPDPKDVGGGGAFGEGYLDLLMVLPGDKVSFGCAVGYQFNALNGPALDSTGGHYNGFTLTPKIGYALSPRAILTGMGGVVFGTLDPGTPALPSGSATGWRAGADLGYVIDRRAAFDYAVHLALLHVQSGDVGANGATLSFAGTVAALGLTFAADPSALEL